jgi:hypothetical protein
MRFKAHVPEELELQFRRSEKVFEQALNKAVEPEFQKLIDDGVDFALVHAALTTALVNALGEVQELGLSMGMDVNSLISLTENLNAAFTAMAVSKQNQETVIQ